jgi:AraC-like DNA-binding protein
LKAGTMLDKAAFPAAAASTPLFPDLAGRGPFYVAEAEIGAAAHFSVRRRQVFRHPRFDTGSVILVLEGNKTLVDQGDPVRAVEGEVIIVPPGCEPDVINAPAAGGLYRALIVGFAPQLVGAFGEAHPQLVAGRRTLGRIVILPDDGEIAEALGRAARGLTIGSSPGRDVLRHRLTEILMLLAGRGIVLGASRKPTLAERVGAEIGRDIARPWTAAEMAKALALSGATLRRHLAEGGTSFSRILAEARLGHALLLLQSSELSVTQIAYAVGYRSTSRFAARFRERYGATPSDLR